MTDIQTKEAEVVELVIVKKDLTSLIKDADKAVYEVMSEISSPDWRNLPPNQMAVLLMQRPLPIAGGGTTYLTFRQALYFAVRAYELGLSPFGSSLWFDPARFSVNITLEGKRELARLRGIDLGPPSFVEKEREWTTVRSNETVEAAKKAGFTKDLGITCKIRVGDPKQGEFSEYTAWLSEWLQPRSPVWMGKTQHMLCLRANEKAITLALGTGASIMPDERELD